MRSLFLREQKRHTAAAATHPLPPEGHTSLSVRPLTLQAHLLALRRVPAEQRRHVQNDAGLPRLREEGRAVD